MACQRAKADPAGDLLCPHSASGLLQSRPPVGRLSIDTELDSLSSSPSPDTIEQANLPSPSPSATSVSSLGGTSSARSAAEDTAEQPGQAAEPLKEQKKRGRVTPEQLAVLEAIFAANRSPNAVRRKEISEQLGMTERQTQIWFQNRRAKEKHAGGKKPDQKSKSAASKLTSPVPPPAKPQNILYPSQDAELQRRIREDDPVIVLPCTQLSIGTWVRIAAATEDISQRHDLLAYICEAQHRLTWFVHYKDNSVEHAVRMDIPLENVVDVTLSPSATSTVSPGASTSAGASDTAARVTLLLSYPPRFFMTVPSPDGGAPVWAPCGDWTEGCQASVVLRHELVGACAPLTYLWARLRSGPARAPRSSPFLPTRTHASMPGEPGGAFLPSGLPSPPSSTLSELSIDQQLRSPALSRRGSAYDPSYFPAYAPHAGPVATTPRTLPPATAAMHVPSLAPLTAPPAFAYTSLSTPITPLSPLFAQSPGIFTDATRQDRQFSAGHGHFAEFLKAEYAEPAPGFALPTPGGFGAGGDADDIFVLPASLSRRAFGRVAPAVAHPQGLPGMPYLATPPPSHSHSGPATPSMAIEGFPWATAEWAAPHDPKHALPL